MDRERIKSLWNEAWDTGLWAGSWRQSVADLSPQQAAWKPSPDRHSIWQIVSHVVFWREVSQRTLAGQPKPDEAEIARRNYPDPPAVNDDAWNATRASLEKTQRDIAAVLADTAIDPSRLLYVLAHDAYHMGQISYVRSLQGMPPIE